MKVKLGVLGAMAAMMSMGAISDRGIEIVNPRQPIPEMPKERQQYVTRTYGAGNNQRKRRKYARQTPSASKWK